MSEFFDLDVWFSVRTTRDRDWGNEHPEGYRYRVLPGRTWYAFDRPLIFVPSLPQEIRRSKPDVIIAVLTRSNALDVLRLVRAAKKLRTPVVLWIGNVSYLPCFDDGLPTFVSSLFEAYYRYSIRNAAAFMFYSSLSKTWALERGASGPSSIGTQVLEPPLHEPRIDAAGGDRTRLLFVGKLEERKGFDLLANALRLLSPEERGRTEFLIAGAGPLGHLAREDSGIQVRHLGHVARSNLWEIYKAADLLVLPSRHDPWGFVVNEAMAMGTPVLASNGCGAAELAGKAGWIFDACDTGSLLQQLRTSLANCRDSRIRREAIAAEAGYRPEQCARNVADLVAALPTAKL
jgi:glycosyltransferase involved in cell wall biosynthesis